MFLILCTNLKVVQTYSSLCSYDGVDFCHFSMKKIGFFSISRVSWRCHERAISLRTETAEKQVALIHPGSGECVVWPCWKFIRIVPDGTIGIVIVVFPSWACICLVFLLVTRISPVFISLSWWMWIKASRDRKTRMWFFLKRRPCLLKHCTLQL